MRFFKDGPAISDDLLNARDEGRVVFFCGAGVSRARAGLSDFFELANKVIIALGVHADSPVHKILIEARQIEARTGVGGLISADRLFGLLEREFSVSDIHSAVAKVLQPAKGVDLSAHRILLDLAKTPDGRTRLVTTNFDRLFHDCDPLLNTFRPPRLPDPYRSSEMHGIVHLHGRATADYSGAEEDGFVLSSSEFGRAYLSDAWATRFFREILDRYVVVFVGYTADDPPVQYLLEALNTKGRNLSGVYAFQSGAAVDAVSKWLHKGVEAISYAPDNDHQALWETLAAWAVRAKSPRDWHQSVIEMARRGAENVEAHERGQVAHLVSTVQGAANFSNADPQPPADWLCVFDPYRRLAKPGHLRIDGEQGPKVNPFDLYGLDSDPIPNKGESNDDERANSSAREKSWDAFALNRLDRLDIRDHSIPAIRGHWAVNQAALPARVSHLGIWIVKVAHQQACVWWAAQQGGLHPDIVRQIGFELDHSGVEFLPAVRAAWRYLFEAWKRKIDENDTDWYHLKSLVEKHGWTSLEVREYAAVTRPCLKVEPNFWRQPKPPAPAVELSARDLVNLDVNYGQHTYDIAVPDEWLESVVRDLRRNLELAVDLENELGGYGLAQITQLLLAESLDDGIDRLYGISACVTHFCKLLERLIGYDAIAAKREFSAWQTNEETIFARLRIWASAKPELITEQEFGLIVASLGEKVFWDIHHQPDLLRALAVRWTDLPAITRADIGNRLLRGPFETRGVDEAQFAEYAASASLSRLHWLSAQGCDFPFELEYESKKLQTIATDWKSVYADKATEPFGMRGGMVRTETEHASLLKEPLNTLLAKAQALSGQGADFLVENDPFAGLCAERPVRAFNTLTNAAKHGDFPEWAWRKFLNSEARKSDKPKFVALIAQRLCSYRHEKLGDLVRPVSDWLNWKSELLAEQFPEAFDELVAELLLVLQQQPATSRSAIIRGDKKPDWAMEALNAPVGKIAQGLMNDSRKQNQPPLTGLKKKWLRHVDQLLALEGDARRHGLVLFSFNLDWFYAQEPAWTEGNILSVLEKGNDQDRDAVWSGFFWGARTPSEKLFVRLKPDLLTFAIKGSWLKRGYGKVLASVILNGWGTARKGGDVHFISDDEMHQVLLNSGDEFRSQVLRLIGSWAHGLDEAIENSWFDRLLHLLSDVWPRQLSAKTPAISASLCNLVFENPGRFSEVAPVVLPLLTRIDLEHLSLHGLYQSGEEIAKLHPNLILTLLAAVLPDEVKVWPYGIENVLDQIAVADADLRADERLIELNRKWNAR